MNNSLKYRLCPSNHYHLLNAYYILGIALRTLKHNIYNPPTTLKSATFIFILQMRNLKFSEMKLIAKAIQSGREKAETRSSSVMLRGCVLCHRAL